MSLKENLSALGYSVAGAGLLFIGVLAIVALFLGMAWVSDKVLPLFTNLSLITLAIVLLVVLPLAIPRASRGIASMALFIASFVFGVTLWMKGLLLCLLIWGIWAVIIGVLLAGVGVVPIAILATILNGDWAHGIELIVLTVLTFGYTVRSNLGS